LLGGFSVFVSRECGSVVTEREESGDLGTAMAGATQTLSRCCRILDPQVDLMCHERPPRISKVFYHARHSLIIRFAGREQPSQLQIAYQTGDVRVNPNANPASRAARPRVPIPDHCGVEKLVDVRRLKKQPLKRFRRRFARGAIAIDTGLDGTAGHIVQRGYLMHAFPPKCQRDAGFPRVVERTM